MVRASPTDAKWSSLPRFSAKKSSKINQNELLQRELFLLREFLRGMRDDDDFFDGFAPTIEGSIEAAPKDLHRSQINFAFNFRTEMYQYHS